uniref:GCF C-terminal domain-containing protein n=1 Tax=Gadus morhua TaxID=8049 RepID=A0A8C4ZIA1_GADMO
MFKKKTRRNIRQRKGESSEEEDEHKIENKDEKKKLLDNSAVTKPSQSSQGRGISCSSKQETTPPKSAQSEGEDALDSRHSTEQKQKASAVLSFSEDKDAEGAEFKLRKSSDKAIVFQAKRKEGSSPNVKGLVRDPGLYCVPVVIIPSAKTIKTARRKRQEARSQKDFISLGRDGRSSAGSTPDRRSRDSDRDDYEPDDCERRIEFAPRAKSVRERIAEKLGSSDESKSDSEEEEQKLWEETQIFKGLKRPRLRESAVKAKFHFCPPPPPPSRLESLKEVHRARQAELRRMEGDVENARSSMENLEGSASDKQLCFYRAMTQYANNLVECLQEKVVEINLLELELHTLLADQMESLLADRRKSVRERAAHLQQLTPDILLRAQTVFSDVQEDFSDIKKILSRFVDWRGAYSDSYHNAYINLCLPKLLSPLVRHQMLAWDPLKDVCADFEALPWYLAVETFCHGQGYEELEDSDTKTLPSVIEKTVLPKITAYVELVWDPLSLGQTAHLSDLCHKLNEDYSVFSGERSKPAKVLVEVLVTRLRSCVDEDVFIPLYPKKFLEDRMSPQCLFRDQQFWTAVKLLGNMGKWDTLLSESVLKELMLDKLLNRYLMMTLLNQSPASSTVTACSKIAGSLPLSWFTGESVCPPQLHSFTNHLVQTAHSVCTEQPPEEPHTR